MHALFMKQESDHRSVMWEVRDGRRWWTVSFLIANGTYHVMNEQCREVKPTGALGRKIIEATKS